MIKVTPAAAEQMRNAARSSGALGLALRLAVDKKDNGSFHYLMGFDEVEEHDMRWDADGVTVICTPEQEPLLSGMTIDYVELEPGHMHFIFINPNDPAQR